MCDRLALGTWAKAERVAAPRGSWPFYEGRIGRIVDESSDPECDEVEVEFTSTRKDGSRDSAWFLPSELVAAKKPSGAPPIRLRRRTVIHQPRSEEALVTACG